jgi:hypothetical protein
VAGGAGSEGVNRLLGRRVAAVDRVSGERWRHRPTPIDITLEVLTPDECERAAVVRERLDAVGLSGIPDADLDFWLCFNERLAGERAEPCVPEGG